MADHLPTSAQATSDSKKRKVEMEVAMAAKADRVKGVVTDKAKANYVRSCKHSTRKNSFDNQAFAAVWAAPGAPPVCEAQGRARMGGSTVSPRFRDVK